MAVWAKNKIKGDRIPLMFLAGIAAFFGSVCVILSVSSGAWSMTGFAVIKTDKALALVNISRDDWYNCKFYLEDKGNRQEYQAFFIRYSERDCKYKDNIQYQLDCVIFNKANRYINYDSARNWDRAKPGDRIEIPWRNFYKTQTISKEMWPTENASESAFGGKIECRNAAGLKAVQRFYFVSTK